jgi:gamma-butyrobetaine dioxygenase
MTISRVVQHVDHVRVHWDDKSSSRFHYVWLRDNCRCNRCKHAIGERTVDVLAIPLDIAASSAVVTEGLDLTWPDGHSTTYDAAWLRANSYEVDQRPAPHRPILWRNELAANLPEISYEEVVSSDTGLLHWLHLLRDYGLCFVRGVPTDPGTVLDVAGRISFLRNTNFGILFDVESKPDPDSLAYTSHRLNCHSDLPNREMPPGLQFLHCLVFEAEGGDSILVDAFACADELRRVDQGAFELLTNTPIRYRYSGPDSELSARSPMIRLDADGELFEIRYSNALLAPLDVAPEKMMDTYRAIHRFAGLLQSADFEIKTRLQTGDLMSFHNNRVLHGRDVFDPHSGHRHLQGCYVDLDDFLSRIRVLERQSASSLS